MTRSLRWRLQLWYAALLLTVVGGYGSILYYQTRVAKMRDIDGQLDATARYLDVTLRAFPPNELEGKDGPAREKKGSKAPPPPKSLERRLEDLVVPRELSGPFGAPEKDRTYFTVWCEDGSILKSAGMPQDAGNLNVDENSFELSLQGRQRGKYREVLLRGPHNTRILVGRSAAAEWSDLNAFAWQLVGIGAGVLAIGLAGGYWLASQIFRPIAAMATTASAISATNLSTRIKTAHIDVELAGLARVLNAMFDRLESAFERQQQFTADASHELRTPLAILRTNAELALSQPRSAEEYRQTVEACLRAANRMTVLVQGLLTLARADAGNPGVHFKPVHLDEVISECLGLFKPLAEEKKIVLTAELAPAIVHGDAGSLTQLVSNLLANAIQHNVVAGKVHVVLGGSSRATILTVTDGGPGIPEEIRPRIFERFFRADRSRARNSGGVGLGLAICQAIVTSHGGTIDVESPGGRGTTFRVEFPMAKDGATNQR